MITQADAARAKVAEFLDAEWRLLARVELEGDAEGWRVVVDDGVDLSQTHSTLFYSADGEYLGCVSAADQIRAAETMK